MYDSKNSVHYKQVDTDMISEEKKKRSCANTSAHLNGHINWGIVG